MRVSHGFCFPTIDMEEGLQQVFKQWWCTFFGHQPTLELLSVPFGEVSSRLCCFYFTFMYRSPGCGQSPLLKAQPPYMFPITLKFGCLPGASPWGTHWSSLPLTGWHLPFPNVKQSVSSISTSRTLPSLWKGGQLHFSELIFFQIARSHFTFKQLLSFFWRKLWHERATETVLLWNKAGRDLWSHLHTWYLSFNFTALCQSLGISTMTILVCLQEILLFHGGLYF